MNFAGAISSIRPEEMAGFDECFLTSISDAKTLPTLATAVQTCVATREVKEGMKPPSEPQLFIGGGLRPLLPLYPLSTGPPPAN